MAVGDQAGRRRLLFFSGLGAALVAVLWGMLGPHNGAFWRGPGVLKEGFSVSVIGSDPHGFDRDNDGYGCESY